MCCGGACCHALVKLGKMLHKYGTPAYRLEAHLAELTTHLGLKGSFIISPTSMTFVLWTEGHEQEYTHASRVNPGDLDLGALSRTDELTGIANRGWFRKRLGDEMNATASAGEPLSLVTFDVDHFKLFNDRYGHPAGDTCLRSVAQALRGATHRPADLLARYGGEEFIVCLSGIQPGEANSLVEKLRAYLSAEPIPGETASGARLPLPPGSPPTGE